jgi:hypothetical protein
MKQIVSIMCEQSVGGTFIDWSIHFLSNQQRYFSWPQQQWTTLTSTPINELNAHGHVKNHPWGIEATNNFFNAVNLQPNSGLYSCYPVQLPFQLVAKKLNLDIQQFADKQVYDKILDYNNHETLELFDLCFDQSSNVVFLETKSQMLPLLSFFDRQIDLKFTELKKAANEQEMFEEQDSLWNTKSCNEWQKLGLINVWDQRERIALDIRPLGRLGIDCVAYSFANANFARPHYRIGVKDLWCRGEQTFINLMQYLQLPIDNTQWQKWQSIYKQWAFNQSKILGFIDNLDYILEAIVNNWYYRLDNLTFKQEVLIQHFLIYRYNLNIKTWQLDKFPNNTQDLHALLETNPHPTQLLY